MKFQLKEGESFGINPLESQFKHKMIPILSNDQQHLLILASTSGVLRSSFLRKGNLSPVKTISTQIPESKLLNELIGGFQLDSMKYVAIYNNKKEDSFSAFEVNLQNDTIVATDFALQLESERILHTFATEDKFYIMTVLARSSTIKIYKIFKSQRGTISLSAYSYDFSKSDQDNTLPNLYKELLEFTIRGSQQLVKTMADKPISLNAAGSNFKLYTYPDKVVLTMDHVHGRTSVYEMYLDSNLKDFQLIYYPEYIIANPYLYTSNSILLGDTLVQFAIGKEDISLFIQNRRDSETVNEYNLTVKALDSLAENLIYRNNPVTKRKSKSFSSIYKDIYKNQLAFTVNGFNSNSMSITAGTSRSINKSKLYQTSEFTAFQEALGDNVSSFDFIIETDDKEESTKIIPDDTYKNLINYRVQNNITAPLLESLVSNDSFHYYCWYSIYTSEIIIRRIPVVSRNTSY